MRSPLLPFALALMLALPTVAAPLRLHRLLQDHAMLQRGKPVNLEGEAAPNAAVDVTLDDLQGHATASLLGHWRITLRRVAHSGV